MPFSTDVKNELLVHTPERECCQRALLASLILGLGEAGQTLPVCLLTCPSVAVVRLILRLARRFDSPPMTWQPQRVTGFGHTSAYHVRVGPAPRLTSFLSRLGITAEPASKEGDGFRGFEYSTVKRRCCQRVFVRGAFLAAGSVGNPVRAYHLEWTTRDALYLDITQYLLRELEVPVRLRRRRYHSALYLKGCSDIAHALNVMGATSALLRLEEITAVKETKNNVHRRVNCETANLGRVTQVAVHQVADIQFLKERLGLSRLPRTLRAAARVRLRYPDASYSELGRCLNPPVSKVIIGRRLQSLCRMAASVRSQNVEEA